MTITPGIYRHYKGKEYLVIGLAVHSETREQFVVYIPKYQNEEGLVIRPLKLFTEEVLVDGTKLPRFALVKEIEAQ